MAKSSLFDSIKFRWLVRTLKMPVPHVAGYLECMWQTAYSATSEFFDDEESLEIAAHWDGEPGEFAKAVLNERYNFADRCTNGRIKIHNFWKHAPQYVKQRKKYNDEQKKNTVKRQNKKAYRRDETAKNLGESVQNGEESAPNDRDNDRETKGIVGIKKDDLDLEESSEKSLPLGPNKNRDIQTVVDRFMGIEKTKNRGSGNQTMWLLRVSAMAQIDGGLARCDEILNEIETRRNPRAARTKGKCAEPIANEASWANDLTLKWLQEHQGKSA